jgi:hypothetical protein
MELIRTDGRQRSNGRATAEVLPSYESVQEFHRRIHSAIEAVQAAIWQAGVQELMSYATDFGFGRERGVQTLVLKTRHKSAYLRFGWETMLGSSVADQQIIQEAIRSAIRELS